MKVVDHSQADKSVIHMREWLRWNGITFWQADSSLGIVKSGPGYECSEGLPSRQSCVLWGNAH